MLVPFWSPVCGSLLLSTNCIQYITVYSKWLRPDWACVFVWSCLNTIKQPLCTVLSGEGMDVDLSSDRFFLSLCNIIWWITKKEYIKEFDFLHSTHTGKPLNLTYQYKVHIKYFAHKNVLCYKKRCSIQTVAEAGLSDVTFKEEQGLLKLDYGGDVMNLVSIYL